MPRYFVAYRKAEDAGQKPDWATFTTDSPATLEARGIRERVDRRLSVFGETLWGGGEVHWLGAGPLVEFLVRREEAPSGVSIVYGLLE